MARIDYHKQNLYAVRSFPSGITVTRLLKVCTSSIIVDTNILLIHLIAKWSKKLQILEAIVTDMLDCVLHLV